MLRTLCILALTIASADAFAQGSIPSVNVPGTGGSVVVGPQPPANNPGNVITITPTLNVPQPTFPNTPPPPSAPGVIVTAPLPGG